MSDCRAFDYTLSASVKHVCLTQTGAVYLSQHFYGHVYVLYNGDYGRVCSDYLRNDDNNGCSVVCRQLGYMYVSDDRLASL